MMLTQHCSRGRRERGGKGQAHSSHTGDGVNKKRRNKYTNSKKQQDRIGYCEWFVSDTTLYVASFSLMGLNAAQSGNQGEGRDQRNDQAEDGKTT